MVPNKVDIYYVTEFSYFVSFLLFSHCSAIQIQIRQPIQWPLSYTRKIDGNMKKE